MRREERSVSQAARLQRALEYRNVMQEVPLRSLGWDLCGPQTSWIFREPAAGTNHRAVASSMRHASLADIFMKIVDLEVIEAVNIQSYNNTDRTGASEITVLRYAAMLALLTVEGKRRQENGKRLTFRQIIQYIRHNINRKRGIGVRVRGSPAMTAEVFCTMHDHFTITPEIARGVLSRKFRALVHLGEFVALDEKLKKFTGISSCARSIPSKPDKRGHWITELATQLSGPPGPPIPYMIGIYPVTTSRIAGTSTPIKCIWEWCLDVIGTVERKPIIVADSYYHDQPSLAFLRHASQPFVVACALNLPGYPDPLKSALPKDLKEPGDYRAAYHSRDGLAVVSFFSLDVALGKRSVVTNCAQPVGVTRAPSVTPPVAKEYALMFSVCDKFNRRLAGNWFPFARRLWTRSLSSTFWDIVFMNVYSLWQSLDATGSRMQVTYKEALRLLAFELIDIAVSRSDGHLI